MKNKYFIPQVEISPIHLGSVLCGSNDEFIDPSSKDKGKPGIDAF